MHQARIAVPTPFAVGRVNCYLIEDDPLTLVDTGPNSGTSLTVARGGAGRARPPRRGPRADRADPPAHRPHRAGADPRRPLRRRGLRARRARAVAGRLRRRHGGRRRASPRRSCAATGSREDVATRCARSRRSSAPGARASSVDAPLARRRRRWRSPTARGACTTGPGTRRRTPSSTTRRPATLIGGDHLHRAHLLQPADRPAAGRHDAASARRRCVIYLDVAARRRARWTLERRPGRATASRSTTTRTLIDERVRLHDRRAAKIAALIAEQPRTRLRASPRRCGATSR